MKRLAANGWQLAVLAGLLGLTGCDEASNPRDPLKVPPVSAAQPGPTADGGVCTRNADCASLTCVDGTCVSHCTDVSQCAGPGPTWRCVSGFCRCVPTTSDGEDPCDNADNDCDGEVDEDADAWCTANGAGGARICREGRCDCVVECGGTCIDAQTDTANCGRCSNACANGATCVAGECACPAGQAACNGSCVDVLADESRCGRCDNACAQGATCVGGECQCPTGQEVCAGACRDTQTDSSFCGDCQTTCTGGQLCQGGVCACPTGQSPCDGTCFDLTSDAAHCGQCDVVCASGASCANRQCACPGAETVCDGACTDTEVDLNHCGTCDIACTLKRSCLSGTCECRPEETFCSATGGCANLLTDPLNCGACGHSCLGQPCNDGLCEPEMLATAQLDPTDLEIDATHVYWSNRDQGGTGDPRGSLMRMELGGGTPQQLAAARAPFGIAIDGQHLYAAYPWLPGYVVRTLLGSGPVEELYAAPWVDPLRVPVGVAVDADNVFWVATDFTRANGLLMRMPKSGGGTPATLSSVENIPTGAMQRSGGYVYWSVQDGVRRVPVGGGTIETVASAAGQVKGFLVDTSHVYLQSSVEGLVKAPLGGGAKTTLDAANRHYEPFALALDGGFLYYSHWVYNTPSSLMRVPAGGGTPTALVTFVAGDTSVGAVAISPTHIYFARNQAWGGGTTPGSIWRVAK